MSAKRTLAQRLFAVLIAVIMTAAMLPAQPAKAAAIPNIELNEEVLNRQFSLTEGYASVTEENIAPIAVLNYDDIAYDDLMLSLAGDNPEAFVLDQSGFSVAEATVTDEAVSESGQGILGTLQPAMGLSEGSYAAELQLLSGSDLCYTTFVTVTVNGDETKTEYTVELNSLDGSEVESKIVEDGGTVSVQEDPEITSQSVFSDVDNENNEILTEEFVEKSEKDVNAAAVQSESDSLDKETAEMVEENIQTRLNASEGSVTELILGRTYSVTFDPVSPSLFSFMPDEDGIYSLNYSDSLLSISLQDQDYNSPASQHGIDLIGSGYDYFRSYLKKGTTYYYTVTNHLGLNLTANLSLSKLDTSQIVIGEEAAVSLGENEVYFRFTITEPGFYRIREYRYENGSEDEYTEECWFTVNTLYDEELNHVSAWTSSNSMQLSEGSYYLAIRNNVYDGIHDFYLKIGKDYNAWAEAYETEEGQYEYYNRTSINVDYGVAPVLTAYVTPGYEDLVSYNWYLNGNVIESETGSVLTAEPVTGFTEYYCEVSDGYSVKRLYYDIRVNNELNAYVSGTDKAEVTYVLDENESVTLAVDASAYPLNDKLSYQWYIRYESGGGPDWMDTEIESYSDTYTVESISYKSTYVCTVSDGYGHSVEVCFYLFPSSSFTDLVLDTPDTTPVSEEVTKYYRFTPQETGKYVLNLYVSDFFNETYNISVTVIDEYFNPISFIAESNKVEAYLEAGKTYYYAINGDVWWGPVQLELNKEEIASLEIDEEIAITVRNSSEYYSFSPDEDGLYRFSVYTYENDGYGEYIREGDFAALNVYNSLREIILYSGQAVVTGELSSGNTYNIAIGNAYGDGSEYPCYVRVKKVDSVMVTFITEEPGTYFYVENNTQITTLQKLCEKGQLLSNAYPWLNNDNDELSFAGWALTRNGDICGDFEFTEDITLYAVWSETKQITLHIPGEYQGIAYYGAYDEEYNYQEVNSIVIDTYKGYKISRTEYCPEISDWSFEFLGWSKQEGSRKIEFQIEVDDELKDLYAVFSDPSVSTDFNAWADAYEDEWMTEYYEQISIYADYGSSPILTAYVTPGYEDRVVYQWYLNGNAIDGEAGSDLTAEPVNGYTVYQCDICDGYSIKTLYYYIHINNELNAYVSGTDKSEVTYFLEDGESVTLSVEASASPLDDSITYSWFAVRDYNSIELQSYSDSYLVESINNNNIYYCEIGDGYGNYTTVWFYLVPDSSVIDLILDTPETAEISEEYTRYYRFTPQETGRYVLSFDTYDISVRVCDENFNTINVSAYSNSVGASLEAGETYYYAVKGEAWWGTVHLELNKEEVIPLTLEEEKEIVVSNTSKYYSFSPDEDGLYKISVYTYENDGYYEYISDSYFAALNIYNSDREYILYSGQASVTGELSSENTYYIAIGNAYGEECEYSCCVKVEKVDSVIVTFITEVPGTYFYDANYAQVTTLQMLCEKGQWLSNASPEVNNDNDEISFAGWTLIQGGDIGEDFELTEDVTVYTVWKPTYLVTFDLNNDSAFFDDGSSTKQERYDQYSVFWDPGYGITYPDEYYFVGWSTDPLASKPESGMVVTEDITLYGVWKNAVYLTAHIPEEYKDIAYYEVYNEEEGIYEHASTYRVKSYEGHVIRLSPDGSLEFSPYFSDISYQLLGWTTEEGSRKIEYDITVDSNLTDIYAVIGDWNTDNHFNVWAENENGDPDSRASLEIEFNSTAELVVHFSADDTSSLSYQWYRFMGNGSEPVNGATQIGNSIKLITEPVTKEEFYFCTVSDGYNGRLTIYFNVFVDNGFKVWPEGAEYYSWDDTFSDSAYIALTPVEANSTTIEVNVKANDFTGMTYEWYRNGDPLDHVFASGSVVSSDGRSAVVSLRNIEINEERYYTCKITDRFGNVEYAYFIYRVENNLRAWPEGELYHQKYYFIGVGDSVTMNVAVSADDMTGITYHWLDIPEADTTNTVTLNNIQKSHTHSCFVSDKYGNQAQVLFIIRVNHFHYWPEGAEEISEELHSDTAVITTEPGKDVVLNAIVEADDMQSVSYYWSETSLEYYQYSWNPDAYDFGKTNSLTLQNVDHNITYYCTVKDDYGNFGTIDFHVFVTSSSGEQTPSEGEQTPSEGEQTPSEGEQTPSEGEVKALHSLELEGEIAVNFYYNMTAEQAANARVEFTLRDNTITVTSFKKTSHGYRCSVSIAAKEATEPIEAKLYIGEELANTDHYSVKIYTDGQLAGEGNDKLDTLMKAMLNYGARSQLYFGNRTDDLANKDLTEAEKQVPPLDASSINCPSITNDEISAGVKASGLKYRGATLALESSTTVTFYFRPDGITQAEALGLKAYVDGKQVTLFAKGKDVCFQIPDIAAKKLGDTHTVKIGNYEFQYSALNYIKNIVSSSSDAALVETVTALYYYYQAAKDYFNY